jgi:hypothetical protein
MFAPATNRFDSPVFDSLGHFIANVAAAFTGAKAADRVYRQLSHLSDSQLAARGLTRADISRLTLRALTTGKPFAFPTACATIPALRPAPPQRLAGGAGRRGWPAGLAGGERRDMFRLARIAGKGRGLLACRPIRAGTVIERAPAVRLPAADRALVDRTALFPYCFADPAGFGSEAAAHDAFVAFGGLTFCNHAENPNAAVCWQADDIGLWAVLEALRDIAESEEITLHYTNICEYEAADFLF